VAISDRRILAVEDTGVTFRYRDNTRGQQVMTLDGVEFLRRFLLHVLPSGFVRIRYYGLLANRVREKNLTLCRELLAADAGLTAPTAPTAPTTPATPPAEDDRDRCPCCGVGRLRAVGVLARAPLPELDAWALPLWDTS
jgi:hypothetical protein